MNDKNLQGNTLLSGNRTFVGFGLGPIQSGLFLFEAYQSQAFTRLVVAEINANLVKSIQNAEGFYYLNIAHQDRIDHVKIGPVEVYNPTILKERESLILAVTQASEMATAVPSVNYYMTNGDDSLHRVMAGGLMEKIRKDHCSAVVYAAENHNRAAEILEDQVFSCIPQQQHKKIKANTQFINTVIGKMSQVVSDVAEIESRGLKTITPDYQHAFLVESFNKILISKITLKRGFERGIPTFIEKKDSLMPFEEAKLFGHNAAHALLGFLGKELGLQKVEEALAYPQLMTFVRGAFIRESGLALISKYKGVDALFTESGFVDYVDDLLDRMTNHYLGDSIERVTRDANRKLGWNDRLVGTMRLATSQGICPNRYALGAAAALLQSGQIDHFEQNKYATSLEEIWEMDNPDEKEKNEMLALIHTAVEHVQNWRDSGKKEINHLVNFCD